MARNIVLLLDGTSNEVEADLTNVLKLYRMLERSGDQTVFYHPGVGTMGLARSWGKVRQGLDTFWGLTTGWRLDDNIIAAYRFLAAHYCDGDHIYLFGFSRGAYNARAVAGMVSLIGLLRPEQDNLVPYALTGYKRASSEDRLELAWQFQRVLSGRRVPIRFMGLWDSVASVIVPRRDRFYLPSLEFLPYTRKNPSVEIVRHACAIDERRRMFRLYPWDPNQRVRPNPFEPELGNQDAQTVWFAGGHGDVGGGYAEAESQVAKYPLLWLVREAEEAGLRFDESMVRHLALGEPLRGGRRKYVEPDARAPIHDTMRGFWPVLEWLPKNARWRQWPPESSHRGIYFPRCEPRPIPSGALIHRSVADRLAGGEYAPVNLPADYGIADTRESFRRAD